MHWMRLTLNSPSAFSLIAQVDHERHHLLEYHEDALMMRTLRSMVETLLLCVLRVGRPPRVYDLQLPATGLHLPRDPLRDEC